MNSVWNELKYAVRLMLRRPEESIVCVLMVAFGLAISLVILQVLFNTQYRSFDIENAGKWSTITITGKETGIPRSTNVVSDFTFHQLQSSIGSFKAMGAIQGTRAIALNTSDADGPATTLVAAVAITPNLLELMEVELGQGRMFTHDDIDGAGQPVVILSYAAWQNHFNAETTIIGRTVQLDEDVHTVIGVMSEEVRLPYHFDFLVPLRVSTSGDARKPLLHITAFGLLSDGADLATATLEAQSVYTRLGEQYPEIYTPDYAMSVSSLGGGIADSSDFGIGPMLWVFAIIILLLASLNVGNLLLSLSIDRRQEFAVRTAMGSSRGQIVRQSLLESFLLCFIGTVLGILIAVAAGNVFGQMMDNMTIMGSNLTRGDQTLFDLHVGSIFAASIVGLLFWLVSSLVPAFSFSTKKVDQVLKGSSSSTTDRVRFRTTKLVVGFEIVISVFLLVLCGGMVGSMTNLAAFEYGFETTNKVVGKVRLPSVTYDSQASKLDYFESLKLGLEAKPGVEHVSYVSSLPFEAPYTAYSVENSDLNSGAAVTTQFLLSISDNYFESLGVPIIEGRTFDSNDSEQSRDVAIIDELLAQRLWPGESALGRTVELGENESTQDVIIVGVAAHISQANSFLNGDKVGTFYRPIRQSSSNELSLIVEVNGGLSTLLQFLREGDVNQDRNVAFHDISSFDDYLTGKSMHFQILAELFIWIGIIASVIASAGVYGLISRSVAQRTKEMGIRRALGSTNSDILHIFLRQGLSYLLVGGLIGGMLGILTTAALTSAFIDILTYLPIALMVTFLCTGLLVFAASYFPARRTVFLEPGEALHYE